MEKNLENVKIAVALRSARTALGWNQQEFADKMVVAKSTIARIETLEMVPKADFQNRALRLFREAGVFIDLIESDKVTFTVGMTAILEAQNRLQNEAMRRSDRKANVMENSYGQKVKPKERV